MWYLVCKTYYFVLSLSTFHIHIVYTFVAVLFLEYIVSLFASSLVSDTQHVEKE